MIRPFTIALLYGGEESKEIAEEMKEVITQKCSDCLLIPLLIDTDLLAKEGGGIIQKDIFSMLDSCDFAYLFLTSYYKAENMTGVKKEVFLCRGNIIFEYGYLMQKLGEKKIKILSKLSPEFIKSEKFDFPSDIPDVLIRKIGKDKTKWRFELQSILNDDINNINLKLDISECVKVDDVLLASDKYSIRFSDIFSKELKNGINKYSIEEQYRIVWENWWNEREKIISANIPSNRAFNYSIMFSYERLIFVMLFKDITIEIDRFQIRNHPLKKLDTDQQTVVHLYNEIYKYNTYMADGERNFFEERVKKIREDIDKLPERVNPLIRTMGWNYLGLACLNLYYKLKPEEKKKKMLLVEAEKRFTEVINNSESDGNLNDLISLFHSYAYYNRARVRKALGKEPWEWIEDYNIAIRKRNALAKSNEFPRFVQLYFEREVFHAKNSKIESLLQIWEDERNINDIKKAQEEIKYTLESLKKYEHLYVGNLDFFYKIKTNAEMIGTKLDSLEKNLMESTHYL